jgi:hypothetical protein
MYTPVLGAKRISKGFADILLPLAGMGIPAGFKAW